MIAFGQNLQRIRKQKQFTQEELADAADLDFTQIGRIERGVTNTSISIVKKIATALKIHPKELFDL